MIEVESWYNLNCLSIQTSNFDMNSRDEAIELLEAKGLAIYNQSMRMYGQQVPATLLITEMGRDASRFESYRDYLRNVPRVKNYFTLRSSRNSKGYGLWFSLFILAMLIILKLIMKKGIL